jgi:hypothetical protein
MAQLCVVDVEHILRCMGAPAEAPDEPLSGARRVFAAGRAACFQSVDNELYCWGDYNHLGTLGVGDREPHPSPARIPLVSSLPR